MIPYPASGKRLYLSGGIQGVPNFVDIFNKNNIKLVRAGFYVIDPRSIPKCYLQNCGGTYSEGGVYHHTWECSLQHDIVELVFCEGIAMIPNWETSQGANLELDIMRRLHLPYNTVDGWCYGLEKLTYSSISHAYVLQQLTVDLRKSE